MTTPTDSNNAGARGRRALVVADDEEGRASLEERLRAAAYETRVVTTAEAMRAVAEFAPDVLAAVAEGDADRATETFSLVRRLRSEAATYALHVVVLFRTDSRPLRAAAAWAGADDYFALSSSAEELRARLDALFWRAEAGRRGAHAGEAEQRAEIDNFLLLLDAVRADAEGADGARGTIALIAASSQAGRAGADEGRTLREAHGFLKLSLRRLDSVAFYGPTLLFVYLPGRAGADARASLAPLLEEFEGSRAGTRLLAGLASFPGDDPDVERLIELAERRLESARSGDAAPSHASEGAAAGDEEPRESPTADAERRERPYAPAATREGRMLDAIDASTRTLLGERRPAVVSRENPPHRTAHESDAMAHAAATSGAAIPRRLLLVVSDPSLMTRLNLLLRSAGVEVRAAFDARQALSLLRLERPDILLVADALSDMPGVEMLRRLALASGGRPAPPAVLLVAEPGGPSSEAASQIGANTVASMPYNPEAILEAIRAAG